MLRCVSLLVVAGLAFGIVAGDATRERPVRAADSLTEKDYRSAWHKLTVPGTWDDQTNGALAKFDGVAWYRAELKVPAEWQGAQVTVATEQIDNAHEVYFNGAKIGGAGSFPPKYESGLKETKRLVVPAEHIRYGEANVVAVRIYDHDGKGGFKGAAPSVTAGLQTIRMEGKWDFRISHLKSEISNLKSQISDEEKLFAARVDDSNKTKLPAAPTLFSNILASPHGAKVGDAPEDYQPVVPPEKVLATFTVPDDLKLELVLSEPEIKQPLFMTWDERGRLWVVQYLQYPYPAGLKMLSRDTFWRAVYDKVPPPPPHGEPGLDKITIHEDTDGDGKLDKHTTFVDGLNIATSFALDRDGVWVMNPPYLLFYPDKNHDGVPDGDPEVHLQGFGLEDTHSVANSLRWGPDGWLYACQGSTTSSAIIRPGIDKQPVHSMGQLIWRYHPATRRFEIFAEGGGNSFGCEIDSEGRIFSGHNGGDTRGFHYTQGGYYQKGFNKHGPLSNPFVYGYFNMMKHAAVPRFTHNFVVYAGAALPDKYNGHLFGVEPLQGRVVEADLTNDRSSFQTKDLGYTITSTDKRFRPVEIKTGPDGAIYVADMYEPQIAHRQHFQGIIDKDTGRIYRIVAKDAKPKATPDFGKLKTAELIDVLKSPNKFHRQTALRLIAQRRDRSVLPQLKKHIEASTGQFAVEYLWATYQLGGLDEPFAQTLLSHKEPLVREWTARFSSDMPLDFAAQANLTGRAAPGPRQAQDDHLIAHRFAETRVAPATARKLVDAAKSETYVRVRSQLASTAKRLPADQALPLIDALLTHNEDAEDIHIPLLLWWAIESKATKNSAAILALLKDAETWKRPLVEKQLVSRLMQRYAQAGARTDLLVAAELLAKAPTDEHKKELLKGFEAAFKGRPLSGLPDELVEQITAAGGGSLALRVRQKDAAAIDEALKLVAVEPAKPDPKQLAAAEDAKTRRIELVQTLGEIQPAGSSAVLLNLAKTSADNDVRSTALTALLGFKEDNIGGEVVSVFAGLPADVQSVALTLLSSRPVWARHLVEAIEAGKLKADVIPLDVVRKLTFLKDDKLAALVKKHWPKLEGASTAEMQEQIAKFAPIAKSEGGVPFEGKKIFMQSCGKCHLLFGEGGRIGPDLTTFKRDDVQHILTNVINPSAEIREGFEAIVVITTDGRTVTGFRADQDARVLVVRGIDGQNISINRDDIEEIVPTKKSLMPEGLLNNLTEQQVRDLFTYLRVGQPLNAQ
jgi:putative heme-binding domain-containing protein